jgi:MFS family permease
VPFLFVKEPVSDRPIAVSGNPPVRVFVLSLVRILRDDRTFVRLITSRLLLGVSMSAFSFYVLFMDRELSANAERLGLFVSAQVSGGLIGGLAIGWLADHAGTRTAIRLSAVVCGVVPCLAIGMSFLRGGSGLALLILGVALFVLIGAVGSTNFIGFMNYLMEVAPLEQRTSYVGLFNTLTGALMVVPPFLGWLLQVASFRALFVVALATSAGSLLVSLTLSKPVRAR